MSTITLSETTPIVLTASLVDDTLQILYGTQTFTEIVDIWDSPGVVVTTISDFTAGGVAYAVFAYTTDGTVTPWAKSAGTNVASTTVPGTGTANAVLPFVVVAIKPDGTAIYTALDPKIRVIRRSL